MKSKYFSITLVAMESGNRYHLVKVFTTEEEARMIADELESENVGVVITENASLSVKITERVIYDTTKAERHKKGVSHE